MIAYFMIGVIFSTVYMMFFSCSAKASLGVRVAVFLIMAVLWFPIVCVIMFQCFLELKRCLKEIDKIERDEK